VSAFSLFLASLFGSPHCVAMCGGFVALYSTPATATTCSSHQGPGTSGNRANRLGLILPQASYHFGRLVTYVSLGIVAAYMGSTLDKVGAMFYVEHIVVPAVGLIIVAWGGSVLLGGLSILPLPKSGLYSLGRLLSIPMRTTMKLRSKFSGSKILFPAMLGLSTTLLPCGWLYGFLLIASTTGSTSGAALTMSLFWLGSIPALSISTVVCRSLGQMANRYTPVITGVLLIVAGFFSLYQHLSTSLPTGGCH
jgi:sulfite exporter TauE/SafE